MSGKKYIILAVIGALILGAGTYFLLNIYFERVSIVAAKTIIEKGQKIKPEDLTLIQYYKGSLPEGYKTSQEEIIGRVAAVKRCAGDPVTEAVFAEAKSGVQKLEQLSKGEILIAINLSYYEPLVETITAGNKICIVSTKKEEKGYSAYGENYLQNTGNAYPGSNNAENAGTSTYQLSGNVIIIDEQIVIKNLVVIDIIKKEASDNNFLAAGDKNSYSLLVKCNLNEAPVLSRITKEDDYKIFLEKL